jgi:NADH-quinone oxidoreductase subunit N
VLIRVLDVVFSGVFEHWTHLIAALSIATMTLGNVIAVAQSNIKRLLAYSSIAQAGYILMGIAVFSATGLNAVLLYLIAYALTNLGAFLVVTAVSRSTQDDHLDAYAGLAKRSPFLAAGMTLFLLSLAGLPPFAGFVAKFFVFAAAIEARYWTLAIAAALNSAVAAYYYFKVVRAMYLVPPKDETPVNAPFSLKWMLAVLLAGIIGLGIFPGVLIDAVNGVFRGSADAGAHHRADYRFPRPGRPDLLAAQPRHVLINSLHA